MKLSTKKDFLVFSSTLLVGGGIVAGAFCLNAQEKAAFAKEKANKMADACIANMDDCPQSLADYDLDFLDPSKREAAEKNQKALANKIESRQKKLIAEQAAYREKQEAERKARGDWNLSTSTDDATGKPFKTASITSTNTVNFSFPYSGEQRARFTTRSHPRYGHDAFLTIEQGQLLCSSYSNTSVLIRFDDGPATAYKCNGAADNSSDVVFIEGISQIEAQMQTAKTMYVTVNVYQEGQPTFAFNVTGYKRTMI